MNKRVYKYDFNGICQSVPFHKVLDYEGITYEQEGNVLRTEEIVVTEKCLGDESCKFDGFFWKESKKGGSIINFISELKKLSKYQAAEWITRNLIEKEPAKGIPELTLLHSPYLEKAGFSEDFCTEYAFGVPEKSKTMGKRISFKIYDDQGRKRGYIGFDTTGEKKSQWFTPKGTETGDVIYNLHRKNGNKRCILASNPMEALILINMGLNQTVAMLTPTLTDAQAELLKPFKKIIVVSDKPNNMVLKLSQSSFVKTVPLAEMTKEI